MKLVAVVLAHDLYRYDRMDLFRATVRSLADQGPDALYLVSNGSTDGSQHYIEGLGGVVVDDPITSCGHGMNVAIGIAAAAGDVVVFSNDDIVWRPGSLEALRRFWAEAPEDIAIASGLLEDEFPWNTVRERIDYGQVAGLVRDSCPGGAWTLRSATWPSMRPIPEAPGWDDVPTCNRMRERGWRVVSLDLADHMGKDRSTWGNGAEVYRRPLDRARWGLPCAAVEDATV